MNILHSIQKKISTKIMFSMFILMILSGIIIVYSIVTKVSNDNIKTSKMHLEMLNTAIFQNIRNTMNSGDIQIIKDAEIQASKIKGVQNLQIVKSKALIELYSSSMPYTKDKELLEVFKNKKNKTLETYTKSSHHLRILKPMLATNDCLSCHTNQNVGDTVGIIDLTFSLDEVDENIDNIIFDIFIKSLFMGLIIFIIIFILVKRATQPIEGLKQGLQDLLFTSKNHADLKLDIKTKDEIADLANLFNDYMDKLNYELIHDAELFAKNVINVQTDIIITNDGQSKIKMVNNAFLKFFEIDNIIDFEEKFGDCICETFSQNKTNNYLQKNMEDEVWYEYVQNRPSKIHTVLIKKNDKDFIFTVTTNTFKLGNEEYKASVFTDVTELEQIRRDIEYTNHRMSDLFNNANQGFLYFKEDMTIGEEVSKKALDIFNTNLSNKNITQVLYNDKEDQEFLASTLIGILNDIPIRQEILISLLKKDFVINGKFIEIEYKVLSNSTFMLIINDITAKKELDRIIKEEQQVLKMVVEVVTSIEQFIEIKHAYKVFVNDIEKFKEINKIAILRREIHTYKGLFAQKEMLNIVNKLHDFETLIDESIKENKLSTQIKEMDPVTMNSWIELDMDILKSILGDNFFNKTNYLNIRKDRLISIYENIKKYQLTKEEKLLKELELYSKELSYQDIQIFLTPYEKLVEQLAKKLNKNINPLVIQSENIFISNKIKPFLNSLVHIFRNSVDHGIESEEVREQKGKDKFANISCFVTKNKSTLIIDINDDGAGIDIERIKTSAINKKLYVKETLDTLNEQEILQIIFDDNFTTSTQISKISGRGVGLSSLKAEVEKLNGSIVVQNNFGNGITFRFFIPYI